MDSKATGQSFSRAGSQRDATGAWRSRAATHAARGLWEILALLACCVWAGTATALAPFTGVAQVSLGGNYSCALTTAGAVKCWGFNPSGQIGDGTNTDRLAPVDVTGLTSGVAAVVAGFVHACAVTTSGAVKCWGYNGDGQLGDGSRVNSSIPVDVVGLGSGVAAVALGAYHSCALLTGGGVKCWGNNYYGQLGDGSTKYWRTPVDVQGLGGPASALAAGRGSTCAIVAGAVKCWGDNTYGQLGDGTSSTRYQPTQVIGLVSGATVIGAGDMHHCAVVAGGAKCWGGNGYGQIGDGTNLPRSTPATVSGLTTGVSAIAGGGVQTCARTTAGELMCWGRNEYGQLGDGTFQNRTRPVTPNGLASGVTSFSTNGPHSCAVVGERAKCWGSNFFGQVGDGSDPNQLLPGDVYGLTSGAAQIGAGSAHSCARTTAGAVLCWGENGSGELGDGTREQRPLPVGVKTLDQFVATVAVGGSHNCALTTGGAVKCWGKNTAGQLGDGTSTNRLTPVEVVGMPTDTLGVAAGAEFGCSVISGGAVKCWGANDSGQLGNGTKTGSSVPVPVSGLGSGVAQVRAGGFHACAVTTAGALKCWGGNAAGQLGDGSATVRTTPVDVVGLGSGVAAVALGYQHTCALTTGGAVKCWGYNPYGTVGDGTTFERFVPVAVRGLGSGVAAIAAGGYETCALLSTGGIKCWGYNGSGQLGDGATYSRFVPADVAGLTAGVAGIGVGSSHTCAVTTGGTAKCWGNKDANRLGNGSGDLARTLPDDVMVAVPDQLALVDVNGGEPVRAGVPFEITVEARQGGVPGDVSTDTVVTLALASGTGPLQGGVSCTIPSGGSACKVDGLVLPGVQGRAVLTAHRATGATLADGTSPAFSVYAAVPAPPGAVTAAAGDGTASVVFLPPDDPGAPGITGYTVYSHPPGGVDAQAGSTATARTIAGLANGTTYTFTVQASNPNGSGPSSAASNGVTPDATLAPQPAATNFQGLWWKSPAGSEAGWGTNFAHQGDIIFATWFTYDLKGKPWWLVGELHRTATGAYTGNAVTVAGPPFGSQPWASGQVRETTVGTMALSFTGGSDGVFSYKIGDTMQSKAITKQVFGPVPVCTWGGQPNLAAATNYQDLWWNPAEPGWGINFTHQGDVIFATWFTYDLTGTPWWLIAELRKAGTGTYAGSVSTVAGTPFGWPFSADDVVETVVGNASVTFADGNAASFSYTVNGVAQAKAITRQVFVPPGTVCQ